MWEAVIALLIGWGLAHLDTWFRDRKNDQAEKRQAALAVRKAAMLILPELRAARHMAEQGSTEVSFGEPLPAFMWDEHGHVLAEHPAYADEWIRLVAAYEIFNEANKGEHSATEVVDAAQKAEDAAWDLIVRVESDFGFREEPDDDSSA